MRDEILKKLNEIYKGRGLQNKQGLEFSHIASTANEYPFAENACWDNPKPLYRKAVRKWKTEREIYR